MQVQIPLLETAHHTLGLHRLQFTPLLTSEAVPCLLVMLLHGTREVNTSRLVQIPPFAGRMWRCLTDCCTGPHGGLDLEPAAMPPSAAQPLLSLSDTPGSS